MGTRDRVLTGGCAMISLLPNVHFEYSIDRRHHRVTASLVYTPSEIVLQTIRLKYVRGWKQIAMMLLSTWAEEVLFQQRAKDHQRLRVLGATKETT
jgi:hypothetical protein